MSLRGWRLCNCGEVGHLLLLSENLLLLHSALTFTGTIRVRPQHQLQLALLRGTALTNANAVPAAARYELTKCVIECGGLVNRNRLMGNITPIISTFISLQIESLERASTTNQCQPLGLEANMQQKNATVLHGT